MLIWTLTIICWSFLNSIFNIAKFWEADDGRRGNAHLDRDSEEALVTCAWEQGCYCLFSFFLRTAEFTSLSWVNPCLSCLSLTYCRGRTRSRPTPCLWLDVCPCPRHRAGASQQSLGWVQLWRAETGEKHWSRLRDGRRRPRVFRGCSLAGLAETEVFRMLVSWQFQMLKLRW